MFNKILVFGGLAVTAILVIENMVTGLNAYVLWDASAKSWMLSLISTIVGVAIWYGLKWMIAGENKSEYDEENDF